MTTPILKKQEELPRFIPLFRYAPDRVQLPLRNWDPAAVRKVQDLPPYLILGQLDPTTFVITEEGWTAKWQGTEDDTYFQISFKANESRVELHQYWRGLDGGHSSFSSKIPVDKFILQGLYSEFPSNWDSTAKQFLESEFQVSIVESPKGAYTFCGMPDGAFRTIAFPISVRNLRLFRQWLKDAIERDPPAYPISVEAKIVFQALNYIEGKAPAWTTNEAVLFKQAIDETGLVPFGLPVREEAKDGSAAWTLRREIYFLFIGIPFAGLTDFLDRMSSTNGPIRKSTDPEFRFELRPIVFPAGLEAQTESLGFWDKARSTRTFLKFNGVDGSKSSVAGSTENYKELESDSQNNLRNAEVISEEIVSAMNELFNRTTGGR